MRVEGGEQARAVHERLRHVRALLLVRLAVRALVDLHLGELVQERDHEPERLVGDVAGHVFEEEQLERVVALLHVAHGL